MKKAFTLVELIVVVIIIGILAAVGIPQYRKALERSRGAEAYAGLGHIQEAEKLYYADNQEYYPSSDPITNAQEKTLDISLPQSGWAFKIAEDAAVGFIATATRKGTAGVGCTADTITVNGEGTVDDSDWKACTLLQ